VAHKLVRIMITLLRYLLFCSLPVRAVTESPAKHRTYASTSEQHEYIGVKREVGSAVCHNCGDSQGAHAVH
jgi:hypothetical protein